MGAKAKKALKKNMKKISASAAASSQLAVPQNQKPSADFLVIFYSIVSNSFQILFGFFKLEISLC